jgi:hypothetical protein
MLVVGTGALVQLQLLDNCFRHRQRNGEVKSSVIKSGFSCHCPILKVVNSYILQAISAGIFSHVVFTLDLYLSTRVTDFSLGYQSIL